MLKKFIKFLDYITPPYPPTPKKAKHSIYALMPDGPMKSNSLGRIVLDQLMEAYNTEYEDTNDREAVLSAITANYEIQTEMAWQAFLANIDDP